MRYTLGCTLCIYVRGYLSCHIEENTHHWALMTIQQRKRRSLSDHGGRTSPSSLRRSNAPISGSTSLIRRLGRLLTDTVSRPTLSAAAPPPMLHLSCSCHCFLPGTIDSTTTTGHNQSPKQSHNKHRSKADEMALIGTIMPGTQNTSQVDA